jgi:hypothetical protein
VVATRSLCWGGSGDASVETVQPIAPKTRLKSISIPKKQQVTFFNVFSFQIFAKEYLQINEKHLKEVPGVT